MDKLNELIREVEFALNANLSPEARRAYIEELKKEFPRISMLNPIIHNERVELISKLLYLNIDYRHFIDIGVSRILIDLLFDDGVLDQELYIKCKDIAISTGDFVVDHFNHNKERLMSVVFLAKSMVNTMLKIGGLTCHLFGRPHITSNDGKEVTQSIFNPVVTDEIFLPIVDYCNKHDLRAIDLLDVGLTWMNIDNCIAYESLTRDESLLAVHYITGACDGALKVSDKIIESGANNKLESLIALFILLKVMITNYLSGCGQSLFVNNVKSIEN